MLFIIPYLFLELYFSLAVGEKIGFFGSLFWIMTTFVIGLVLLQNAHVTIMKSFNSLSEGKLNGKSFHDASTSYFIGAILLMIPGVFSDFLGVIALLYTFYLQLGGTIPNSKNKTNINNSHKQGDEDVIDVEIIESSSRNNIKP